ncbi:ATP-binding cassette sub-family D member 3-like isoform X2 [Meleagris gallopavo]|uniref:ATP-binding cassette sub-family D member 3-like isoform X2 n=1 Tax=Meleagris gallopavo TaxID=9103 RepID=UPI0005499A4B|nr:ATP-binding cassette sub-family D member 3-like isoform X2 [Meleagris gallopavo]
MMQNTSKRSGKQALQNNEKEGKKERAMVDRLFIARICRILKIMVPRAFCKETGYLLLIAVMLVVRTYCDIWMIQNGTVIESAIIGRSRKDFKKYLFNFIAAMPAVSAFLGFKIFSAIRMAQIKNLRKRFQMGVSVSVGSSCFM